MPNQVVMGAMMTCSFGVAPSSLVVTPEKRVIDFKMPAATIMDHIPMKNIMPFGACSSLANPTVAAATPAAWGVLTPMPCIPATTTPWITGAPTVLIGKIPALDNVSKCMCMWAGVIQFTTPGEFTTNIP